MENDNLVQNLSHRKATLNDLKTIVNLLFDDDLGKIRELQTAELDQRYIDAFHQIDSDPNHYLMIVEYNNEIAATCHLIIIPSLSFIGSSRMQIESVRVAEKYRGNKIGRWMIDTSLAYGKSKGVSIVQLTTNKKRAKAKQFYERCGFEASHEGMKLYLNS